MLSSKVMLTIFEMCLKDNHHKWRRMDGDTPIRTRGRFVEEFNRQDEIDVFLLTTGTGGEGITLSSADR